MVDHESTSLRNILKQQSHAAGLTAVFRRRPPWHVSGIGGRRRFTGEDWMIDVLVMA
jgi:hypothetical protein